MRDPLERPYIIFPPIGIPYADRPVYWVFTEFVNVHLCTPENIPVNAQLPLYNVVPGWWDAGEGHLLERTI